MPFVEDAISSGRFIADDDEESPAPERKGESELSKAVPAREAFNEIPDALRWLNPADRTSLGVRVNPYSQGRTGQEIAAGIVAEETPKPFRAVAQALFPEMAPDAPLVNIPPSVVAALNPVGLMLKPFLPQGGKEFISGMEESVGQMASGMTSPEGLVSLPAFAAPVIGPAMMLKMGAEGVAGGSEQLGTASVTGDAREAGRGIGNLAGAAAMLLPGVKGARSGAAELWARTQDILPRSTAAARDVAGAFERAQPIDYRDLIQEDAVAAAKRLGIIPERQLWRGEPQIVEAPSGEVVPVERGPLMEQAGGKVSFAAEAPVLNREAIGPRVETPGFLQTAEQRVAARGESAMEPYRSPVEFTAERAAQQSARSKRQSVEQGLTAEQPPFQEIVPQEGQYPPGAEPSGVLSRLQRSRIIAKQRRDALGVERAQEAQTPIKPKSYPKEVISFWNDNVATLEASKGGELRNIPSESLRSAIGSLEQIVSGLERGKLPTAKEYSLLDKADRELTRRGEQPPAAGFKSRDIPPPEEPPTDTGGAPVPQNPPKPTAPAAPASKPAVPSSPNDFVPALMKPGEAPIVGKKGQIHQDIYDAQPDPMMLRVEEPQHGFVNTKTGEFISREQLNEQLGVTDSQGLAKLQKATPETPAVENLELVGQSNLGRASEGGDVPAMILPDGTALIGESHPTIIAKYETLNPGVSTEGAVSGFIKSDGTFRSSPGWPELTTPIKRVERPQADLAQPPISRDIQTVESELRGLRSLTENVARDAEHEPYFQRIDQLEAELGQATPISETIGGKRGESPSSEINQPIPGVNPPRDSAPVAEPISAVKKGGEGNGLQGKEKVQEEILDANRVQQSPQPEPAPSNVPIEATTATPAVGSFQSLGITPPGTQQLQSLIDAAISKPQGVDTPIRTDTSTPLPDFQPHAASKKIFSQPFGFERLPVLGALWGGLRRLKGNVNEAITAYHGERNVGRAVASALAQEYSWIKKPFTIKDGQIQNIGATEGQSRYISDVFEALQRDPNAYPLNAEQRAAFDAMQKLEGDFKKLEQKYGLSKAIEEEGGIGTEGGEGQRAYFPRVVVEAPEGRGRTLGTGAKVGGKAFFEKSRLFETEAEGWQKGWKYEEDIARRIATRAERLYKRISDKRLADDPTLGGISRKELDAQLKDGYAEELAAGEITEAKLQQIGDSIESQGRVWQPQFFNKIFPRETADAMNKAFPQTQSGLRSMAANANNALKGLWLGFDLGAGFIQGQGTMFYQPKVWAKAQANSLRAMVSPEFFPEYVRQNLDPIREMAQLGSSVGRMEEMLAGAERGELLNRIPGVKQTVGKAIQPFARQFQTFIDTAKVELWKGLRETTPQAEWPRVMQTIESTLSTSRMEPVGISAGRALAERALLIAPSYYRGALNLVAGMAEKGVSGQTARRAMGAYMTGGALLFYGVGKALGMSDEDLLKRFDPRRSDFMLWRIKTGNRTTEVGFGGIFKSLLKLGGNIVKTSVENPENWKSLSPEKNPITRWYRGHAGPAVGLVWDQFSGRDFMGQEANLGDLSKVPLPMVARTALTEGQRFSPLDTAATFAGLTAFERVNPASQEVNKLAAAYRKKAGLPDTADFVTKETPARKVREALQQKDTKAAMAALQELRKTKKDPDIFQGFQQARNRPFTGSMEREAKFKAGLTPQQRALYDKAKAERDRDWEAFRELWRNKPSR